MSRRQRGPEVLWNPDTMARALDVSPFRVLELLKLELIPMPTMISDECFWVAAEVRAWAQKLGTVDPADAVAGCWARWQHETLETLQPKPKERAVRGGLGK
ncbi:MAG: hypothetical protein H3C30_19515 [Candidatus Hydrogenedentes bacterium]|nr:hypothetical protein [Candidatus Hydrogenedentota bacterium]